MSDPMSNIEHLIVLMLENRSFDNLLGWLYGPGNLPKHVIGKPTDPPFVGLTDKSYWNPSNRDFFTKHAPPHKVFATRGTAGRHPFRVPNPDPEESFDNMTFQIFGTTTQPVEGTAASMLGFLIDYQNSTDPTNANTIMETYSTEQVSMLSGLAANFAVCDQWFASAPCQTWPNRAFVHTGTANGRVNNFPYDPFDFDVKTIFNVLEEARVSWAVYNDSILESITRLQLPQLWDPLLDGHFHGFDRFVEDAKHGKLPRYSFVEPSFLFDPNDEHPPHDVCHGEHFLEQVYSAVVNGQNWNRTLLLITFDEHGGCADHWPTPWGAATPDEKSNPGQEGFRFNRFGVRVPAVIVSPWVEPGTVFRSTVDTPYDHTSILATIRDWLPINKEKMLPSERIKRAPTLATALNASSARTDKPVISPSCKRALLEIPVDTALNDLQCSVMVATMRKGAGRIISHEEVEKLLSEITTIGKALKFFKGDL
ncbi:MAG TPA: alkaline phosphatase family protein [Blastocatellia bacterium]|nr:alkaline phosphatase family protein [Blastocatellia bacterium]